MKFSCRTPEFLQALQLVSRAISNQQALPILGNILLRAEKGICIVSATDLEISIITKFPAEVEREGAITIPAKAILNFAQFTTDPEVTLESKDGTQLRCSSLHSKTTFQGEAATEYPTISTIEGKTSFTLDGATLLEALHYVTFAAAHSSLRPVLSGVSLRTEGGKIFFVATDSYRLSEYSIETDMKDDISCIVPVKVLDELKMILSGKKPAKRTATEDGAKEGERAEALPVRVTLSQQQIEMQINSTHLLSRLIEGKFPDYHQIIPSSHTTKGLLSTFEFTTAVRRMHYFAKEMNNNLTFTFGSQDIQMTTPQTPLGKDEATIAAEVQGEQGKIALSSSYLLDFLGHANTDVVEIRMIDSMHPAVFYAPGNARFLHLIMPLRMQESGQ